MKIRHETVLRVVCVVLLLTALGLFVFPWQNGSGSQGAQHLRNALRALDQDEWYRAEVEAEMALVFGGDLLEGPREDILAHASCGRALEAERLSRRVEAGLPSFDLAVNMMQRALEHWRRAARIPGSGKGVLRNIERGLRKLKVLEKNRASYLRKSLRRQKDQGAKGSGRGARPRTPRGRRRVEDGARVQKGALQDENLSAVWSILRQEEEKRRRERRHRRGLTERAGGGQW